MKHWSTSTASGWCTETSSRRTSCCVSTLQAAGARREHRSIASSATSGLRLQLLLKAVWERFTTCHLNSSATPNTPLPLMYVVHLVSPHQPVSPQHTSNLPLLVLPRPVLTDCMQSCNTATDVCHRCCRLQSALWDAAVRSDGRDRLRRGVTLRLDSHLPTHPRT